MSCRSAFQLPNAHIIGGIGTVCPALWHRSGYEMPLTPSHQSGTMMSVLYNSRKPEEQPYHDPLHSPMAPLPSSHRDAGPVPELRRRLLGPPQLSTPAVGTTMRAAMLPPR